jgi:hypothetical protein
MTTNHDIFQNAHAPKELFQLKGTAHSFESNRMRGDPRYIFPSKMYFTRIRKIDPGKNVDKSRLARTIRAYH